MSKKRKAETFGVVELLHKFSTEKKCVEWLEQARWGRTPICPHCGGLENFSRPPSKPFTYWHKDCRKQFTVTTGTVMHSRKTSLQHWMVAIYLVLTARKGISAMQLSKELQVQYRTAWHMLHRIREACSKGDFQLEEVVEVDETYVGGRERNKHPAKKLRAGRGTVGKTTVMGARQRGGKVKAAQVEHTDAATMTGFVKSHVAQGATVYTDDAKAYKGIPFNHETVSHSAGEYVRGAVHTNSIESVWAVLKRSITGTWHHVSNKHLDRYVSEAVFRLNEGNCEVDTINRMKALAGQTGDKRLRYKDLVAD